MIVYAYRNRKTRIVRRKGGFKVFRIEWLAVNNWYRESAESLFSLETKILQFGSPGNYKMGVLGKTISFMALFTFDISTKYQIPHNDFLDPFNDILFIRR